MKRLYSPVVADSLWGKMQIDKFKRDETYFRHITRLPLKEQVAHLSLRLSGVIGVLFISPSKKEKIDALISIVLSSLSSLNALNIKVDISEEIYEEVADWRETYGPKECFVIYSSGLSAACEKLEHLEEVPFKSTISHNCMRLLATAVWEIDRIGYTEVNKVITEYIEKGSQHLYYLKVFIENCELKQKMAVKPASSENAGGDE